MSDMIALRGAVNRGKVNTFSRWTRGQGELCFFSMEVSAHTVVQRTRAYFTLQGKLFWFGQSLTISYLLVGFRHPTPAGKMVRKPSKMGRIILRNLPFSVILILRWFGGSYGNFLWFQTKEDDLRTLMGKCGKIVEVRIPVKDGKVVFFWRSPRVIYLLYMWSPHARFLRDFIFFCSPRPLMKQAS